MSAARRRWSAPVRLLHWTMAGLVLTLLGLGLVMTQGSFDLPTSFTLYQWHKWIGLLVLALWLPRLLARLAAPAPAAVPGWQGRAAGVVHGALYGLLLALPLSGWLATSASPLHLPLMVPVPFYGLVRVPDLIGPDAAAAELLGRLHAVGAFSLLALVALHVAAALKHALVDRDDILKRMIR